MPLSIRLGEEPEQRLERACRRLRLAKSEMIKRSLSSFLDQMEPSQSAYYAMGGDLFGADDTHPATLSSTYKKRLKAKLRTKHNR
jgi:hypothetical protein